MVFAVLAHAAAIVLLYWIENLIVGLFNVLRMILVKAESAAGQFQKLFMIPFFCVHFTQGSSGVFPSVDLLSARLHCTHWRIPVALNSVS